MTVTPIITLTPYSLVHFYRCFGGTSFGSDHDVRLRMEGARSTETPLNMCHTTRRHILDTNILEQHHLVR
jgi:hypothetical protein